MTYSQAIDGKFRILDCIHTPPKSSARCLDLGCLFIIVLFLGFSKLFSEFLLLSIGFHLLLSAKHKRALSIQ